MLALTHMNIIAIRRQQNQINKQKQKIGMRQQPALLDSPTPFFSAWSSNTCCASFNLPPPLLLQETMYSAAVFCWKSENQLCRFKILTHRPSRLLLCYTHNYKHTMSLSTFNFLIETSRLAEDSSSRQVLISFKFLIYNVGLTNYSNWAKLAKLRVFKKKIITHKELTFYSC